MRALLANIPLKALSLVLAGLLWFVIAGEKTAERGLSAPVELRNFPKDLELTGELIDAVEVRLRASPGIIHALAPQEISAQIDLAGAGEGERIVHLTSGAIRVPFGVKVVKITPSILTLNFERSVEKLVPIRPRILGRPAAGFEVAEIVSEPAEARIAGPQSRVQEVESAFTEPVSVEGARAPVADSVNIGLEDPLLRVHGLSRVRVTARVREVHERRVFEALGVTVRGGAAQLRPSRVRVALSGPASVLKGVDTDGVRPYVELGPGRGSRRLPVAVELAGGDAGVTVESVEPAEVLVRPLPKER
jgi:YbbR domain-containing protein